MKVHYFQRYHSKENVATANTMLLLSRLYYYSTDKFYNFLKSEYFDSSFEPELEFNIQTKGKNSVPDAIITQAGFQIVVETKITDWFYSNQLERHLTVFGDVKNKVLISLASEPMKKETLSEFETKLKEYNRKNNPKSPIRHINTTFEELINAIQATIDDRDYKMQDVLDDYLNYCYVDGLILGADSWKFMRMQLAGTTLDFNLASNVYYDKSSRGFRAHDYLALYKNKSVRALGKICARITAIETPNGIEYETEFGELTEERKSLIVDAMADGDSHGYDLRTIKHRYFFVEKFYEMDYKKDSPGGCMGSRIFDLSCLLGVNDKDCMPSVEEIADKLSHKTWS